MSQGDNFMPLEKKRYGKKRFEMFSGCDDDSGEEHFSEYYDGHRGHHHGGYHHGGYHHGGYRRRQYGYMNELFTARFILVIFAIFILFSVLLAVSSGKN